MVKLTCISIFGSFFMKKLFLFLSICSTLFFASCSNFFAPFNNTGRIVINFSSKDAAKSIFTEVPDFERNAAPIKIEIVNDLTGDIESQEITINISDDNPNKSQQQTVTFENVQAGTWTVNCYVLIKDTNGFIIDEIGFDSRTVSVEAGMSADVFLKPEYNIINTSTNQVKTINLIQNPSKLSYVLDDPLEADDAIFELELQNGYKTEMTFGEIKSKFVGTIETSVSFSEPTTSGIPATAVTKATRGNFNIVYKITRKLDNITNVPASYFTVPITLKAKPPVITKHPGKETFTGVQHPYKFTVEASLPTYEVPANNNTSASLIYHWDSAGSTYTPSQFDETKVAPYYEGEVNRNGNSNTLYFQYIQCTVINYDKDGLSPELYGNNEYPTTTSRYGTLEERYPSTSTPNARYHMIEADINICSEDTEFISEYKNGEWTTPPVELFVIKKTFDNDVHQNSTSTGRYYDFTTTDNTYSITVQRTSNSTFPSFGYVPYRVSYSFEEDGLTWTNTKTITIPTKLASLPNLDPHYADANYNEDFGYNYCERYYNPEDNKFYCKKTDGSLTDSIANGERIVSTNNIYIEALYYSNRNNPNPEFPYVHYIEYAGTRNSWASTESMYAHKTSIIETKKNPGSYISYLTTELTFEELNLIQEGKDVYISLDTEITVSNYYSNWVVDCTPIRKSLPPVKFSLLQ